jgi:hypothetical protein
MSATYEVALADNRITRIFVLTRKRRSLGIYPDRGTDAEARQYRCEKDRATRKQCRGGNGEPSLAHGGALDGYCALTDFWDIALLTLKYF